MYRYSFACLGLDAVFLSLFIFSSAKKIKSLSKITSFFLMPLLAGYTVLFLLEYRPDSFNLGLTSLVSFALATISIIMFSFEEKRVLRISSVITFLLSEICWLYIYHSTFLIYKIQKPVIITAIVFYLIILVTVLIIAKSKKSVFYIVCAIVLFISSCLLFTATVTLLMSRTLYSITLFAGALLAEVLTVYDLLQSARFNFKHKNFIRLILYFSAQLLCTTAGLLMFYFS